MLQQLSTLDGKREQFCEDCRSRWVQLFRQVRKEELQSILMLLIFSCLGFGSHDLGDLHEANQETWFCRRDLEDQYILPCLQGILIKPGHWRPMFPNCFQEGRMLSVLFAGKESPAYQLAKFRHSIVLLGILQHICCWRHFQQQTWRHWSNNFQKRWG